MKVFFALSFFCTILLALTCAQGDESNFYSRRYDSIDVNTIFRSSRLLNNYVDCLLDKKPCPPEGKDLKRVLPDALKTRCAQCTKIQKQKALNVITKLYYEYPAMYMSLAERFDSTGEYTRNFENWFDEQNAVKPQENFSSRIPSTWITSSTITTTTRRPSTTRFSLRTSLQTTKTTQRPATTRLVEPQAAFRVPMIPSQNETFRTEHTITSVKTKQQTIPPIFRGLEDVTKTQRTEPPSIFFVPQTVFQNFSAIQTSETYTTPSTTDTPKTSLPTSNSNFPLVESTAVFNASKTQQKLQQENVSSPPQSNFPEQPELIDNFFVPSRNGPFRRSVNRILNTRKKIAEMAQIITGLQ